MSHCRLLFVGGRKNLQQILDNCPDSSSESAAEMAIGADWIADYEWLDEEHKKTNWITDNFTKENKELYEDVINGYWYDCFDIRDINHYGSFDCLNCPDFEPYVNDDQWEEREKRNKARVIEVLKTLPDDTLFHFADGHY